MVNNKLCTDVGPHTNVNMFTLKNVTWRTYLITFTVQCCFLFRFVSIELVSLILVLQIWVAIYVCGTIIFNKEINANVYRHSLWEYSKRFHCSFEWHLTPHMTLSIKTCIRRTPCIKRTLQHSPRVSAWYRFHCSLSFFLVLEQNARDTQMPSFLAFRARVHSPH